MDVEVVWGSGRGETALGAVDGALAGAGIHNYNLVRYSSILPASASVSVVGTHDATYGVGSAVPVVVAEAVTVDGGTVAAGLGWQTAVEGGVVYEVSDETADRCRNRLELGLADARQLRDWDWEGDPSQEVVETTVDEVGAVVVAAVYPPLERVDPA